MSTSARAISGLAHRELLRLVRQPTRVVASVGTPLVLWGFLVAGLGGSMGGSMGRGADAAGYAAWALPGMGALVAMFAAIFGAISLIEDKREGFLRGALTSPTPRWALALGKVLPAAVLAAAQAGIVLAAGPFVGVDAGPAGYAAAVAAMGLMAVGIAGACLAAGWWVDSVSGFHGVMNLALMPAWLLSGAVTTPESSAGWLATIARINPLGWGLHAARAAMGLAEFSASAWAGTAAFAAGGVALAVWAMGRRPR
jgi:ABC-2 type transport system permease protein